MAMDKILFQREIPVRYDVDVFVAGGGPAGVAAAASAARNGCSVYLAEAQGCLGGMGTSGLVTCFMTFSDGRNFVAGGFGKEIFDRLHENKACIGDEYILGFQVEELKRIYDDILTNAGIRYTYFTSVIGTQTEHGKIESAVLSAKSGLFAVRAKIYIDCTGDGDLSALAGAHFEKGDRQGNMMPGTLCSLWTDIDWNEAIDKNGDEGYLIDDAFKAGVITTRDRHLPGMGRIGLHTAGGNIGHAFGVDGTDELSMTKAIVEQRKIIKEYEQYYRRYLKGYQNLELMYTAPVMGIRDSRRIIGDYVLNLEDFEKKAIFEDEIGRYCYFVDMHPYTPDRESFIEFEEVTRKKYSYAPGESYGIPYRILTPENMKNLLVAGRCVSCDRYMQSSIRVMPGCYITGQAAGTAAAIAVAENTDIRGFAIQNLQAMLNKDGAFLPNNM